MQQLILVLVAIAAVVMIAGTLIPLLVARADTPEARAERERALSDELRLLR